MKDNHSSANQDDCRCPCPIETSLNLIGGKYKALILWKLMNRTLRFSELRKQVPKATPKMLTQQLRELEQDGLVLRQVYAVVPPKVEYSLTTKGKSLEPILQALCSWGKTCLNNAAEPSD